MISTPPPLRVKLAWFVGLWVASVLALGAVAEVLRWALHP
jgi:hypothetical protein